MNIRYDYARPERIGMPEAVFCQGKTTADLNALIEELLSRPDQPVLFTRLTPEAYEQLASPLSKKLDYEPVSRTAMLPGPLPPRPGRVAVVCAGTTDLPVALEARRTLEFMGVSTTLIADVGVAGLWRLMERLDEIRRHDVVIAVAGMDAALTTVLGGLIAQPLIGVPTSVGYGVASGGTTALNAMLASCAQGLMVTNIDNGFGAACGAVRLLNSLSPTR